MRNIFIVTGYGAAGKSTLINSISEEIEVDILQFGRIHKLAYKNAGYTCTADWLAKEGYDTYDREVLKLFKRRVEVHKNEITLKTYNLKYKNIAKEKIII